MRPRACLLLVVLAACTAKPEVNGPAPLTPAEQRGRQLFLHGRSADGRELVGFIGEERVELSGAAAACARCHGPSGAGTVEGGIGAPELRRNKRPAATLVRAIEQGRAEDGRALSIAMPRFALSAADRADLLAWLQRLGTEPTPGVSDAWIRIGAAVPLTGAAAARGGAVAAVLRAKVAQLNAQGGLLRRRVELVVEDDADGGAVERLVRAEPLAVLAPMFDAPDAALARLDREGIPVIGPVTPAPEEGSAPAHAFFLQPALEVEAPSLLRHAVARGARRVLVVAPDSPGGKRWCEAARNEAEAREGLALREWRFAGPVPDPAALAEAVRAHQADAIVAHCPQAALPVLARAAGEAALHVDSRAFSAGAAQAELRFSYAGPVHPFELRGLNRLHGTAGLPRAHLGLQHHALVAAEVLEEALLRSGRALTREALVGALESLNGWRSSDGFAVSFGPNRRTGYTAVRVVRTGPDGRIVPESDWIEP